MNFPIPERENSRCFKQPFLQEPIQQKSYSQDSLVQINSSSGDEDVNFSADASVRAASIYGGVAGSVIEVPPKTRNVQDGFKSVAQPAATANTANWSPSLQNVLDQPPSALPQGLILGGMVFCAAFGAWATFGQIDEVGHAQGRLVPKGEPYKIHSVVSGKVARIDIKEGQEVKAGQVLFELDSQIAVNEVERLLQERSGYQRQLIQTQALIEKTRLEAETVAQSTKADAQAAEIGIAQAKAKVQAQEATISESQKKAAATRELQTQLQEDLVAHNARLEKLKPLVAQGALGTEQLFQAQQALRDRQRSITQSQGELQQTLAQLDRLQAERQQALAEPNRLLAERDRQAAQGRKALVEAEQKIQQLRVQKTQLQAKFDENEKLLTRAKAELKQLSLTAPVDGVVSSLNVPNTGEVVKQGQTIAEIAPEKAPLILSATLPNRDAGFVKTGMAVQLKFDAYPYQDYGIVSGKVISVSPDTKPDEKLGPVYRVEVALDRNYVTANHKTINFKAGQTAGADIIIRRRRIADILLDPIRQLQKGGMSL